jgi:phenylacetate-coenzyme A ligase PaaK-like adenylate-forming protein
MSEYERYVSLFDNLLQQDVYGLSQADKEALLLPIFNLLHRHHIRHCEAYHNLAEANHWSQDFAKIEDLRYVAVRLFKHLQLMSISTKDIFKTLQSSGTTGQTPARIYLDKDTSSRQSKVLVKILQESIGKQRLPMLIIDSPAILKDKAFSARAAGIQGLAFFGRDHSYALDENMQPNWPVIEAFAAKYQDQAVLLFGFTFMVWQHFIEALEKCGTKLSLNKGILLHSGGWKKLEAQKVDNKEFKKRCERATGIKQVSNFYGMAEQVGSVFVECEQGHLHTPLFADVIVRDPYTLAPCSEGQRGLLQVMSALPTSYPGFSLLTEDLGEIIGTDDCPCGKKGKYFAIHGRLPKTEVRGCSDTASPL